MPRKNRITHPNIPHFIVTKINSSSKAFLCEEDFYHYIAVLKLISSNNLAQIHAFCLCEDEIRFLVTPKIKINQIMQRIHAKMSKYFLMKNLSSPYFLGRYKSFLVPINKMHLAARNILLWPVRNGLAKRPHSHPYSSAACYLESAFANESYLFIDKDIVFQSLYNDNSQNYKSFANFLEEGVLEHDDLSFIEKCCQMTVYNNVNDKVNLHALAKKIELLLSIDTKNLSSANKSQDIVTARRFFTTASILFGGCKLSEVATYLNRDKSQVSRLLSQGLKLVHNFEHIEKLLQTAADEAY